MENVSAPMLKLFVVNLAMSHDRREKISKRLNELNLAFEIFEAIDGREKPHPLFSRYNDRLRVRYRRKPLSGGELGCFASHFLLWQKCVELNEPIVVLEDDVVIHDNFLDALAITEDIIDQVGYLRLAGTSLKKSPYSVLGKIKQFDFVEHHRGPTGTLCYVITPKSAKTILDHSKTWFLAVDDHLDRYWEHGVYCYRCPSLLV